MKKIMNIVFTILIACWFVMAVISNLIFDNIQLAIYYMLGAIFFVLWNQEKN